MYSYYFLAILIFIILFENRLLFTRINLFIDFNCVRFRKNFRYFAQVLLTLNLLTTTIVAPPSNASKGQMGFNSAFKGLK